MTTSAPNYTIEAVMNFEVFRGISIVEALEFARSVVTDRQANFSFWAVSRHNETAFQNAKAALLRAEAVVAVLEAAHAAECAQIAAQATKAPRCAWYREIRRCYAIARESGLDTKADEKMRAAFGRFLGREIKSREQMKGGDWNLVANAIKAHNIAW